MKMRLNIFVLACGMILSSCLDDKGNYDYRVPANQVLKIDLGQTASFNAVLGDSIKIYPRLTYVSEQDTNRFDFEWRMSGQLYSTTRELVYRGKVIGNDWGVCSVVDRETGVRKDCQFTVSVSSLFSNGWTILSKDGDRSVIGMVISKYINGAYEYVPYRDVYYDRGEEMGRDPVKLESHYPEILVIQSGGRGPVELDGNTLSPVVFMKEEFLEGRVPVGFAPVDAVYTRKVNVVLNKDGQLYMRYAGVAEHVAPYNNEPMNLNIGGKPSRVSRLIKPRGAFGSEQVLVHDSVNNRLLCFAADSYNKGGSFQVIPDKDFNYPVPYTRLSDLGSMQLVFATGTMRGATMGYFMVLKDALSGTYYCQKFGVMQNAATDVFTLSVTGADARVEILLGGAELTAKSQFIYFPTNGYVFFTAGVANDQLYFYNTTATSIAAKLVKGFNADEIKALRAENLISVSKVGIGLASGDFVLIDVPYNFHTNIVYTELCRLNFGEIVDVCHKPNYFQ